MWVSPFRHLRVSGYLLLSAAFRSLSRLSSALSAKASTLRPSLLNLIGSSLREAVSFFIHSVVCQACFFHVLHNQAGFYTLLGYLGCLYFSYRFSIFVSVFDFQGTHTVFTVRLSYSHLKLLQLIDCKSLNHCMLFTFLIRQPPALPCRLQHSTIGRLSLNLRVRYGYGCLP